MNDKTYVLEWSKKQNCFHIQPIEITLANNQKCFIKNTTSDYLVIMVGSHNAVCDMADSWRHRLIERES
jgi:hypothetical protein